MSKLLLKFQNILRNTTQVIIRHRVKILFSVISSPITLERQKWKGSSSLHRQAADKISKHSEKHYPSYHTTYGKNPIFRHIKSNNSGMSKVKIVKNERDPPLFTSKLLIKFQNILRNTTQVIIRHRVKILFSVISSPITLERQKWKSSKMKGILLSSPVSCW